MFYDLFEYTIRCFAHFYPPYAFNKYGLIESLLRLKKSIVEQNSNHVITLYIDFIVEMYKCISLKPFDCRETEGLGFPDVCPC